MDALILSRVQFAITIMFHYLYPPLTIGLAAVLVILATKRLRSGEALWDRALRFWVHLFGINFAVGVATGIVMEFQFGTNWSRYSRFVGDIFGAPLAAEGVLAFFLESGFLAVLLFGWDRVSKRAHWFSALMVALGSTLSAFWIVVANSWQQTPAGFRVVDGRAELTDFLAAVFNPSTLPRFSHVILAAWVTGAFFVAGISAWYLLKGREVEFARKSMGVALVFGLVAMVGSVAVGDWHGRQVAKTQPEKFAAMEGLEKTQKGAPLRLLPPPLPDVGIPKLLSLMVYFDPEAEVKGLDAFPAEELPPVVATSQTFHAMVGLGFAMLALMALALWFHRKGTLEKKPWLLKLLLWSIPVPFLVNQLGWVTAEVGRQPWIVYRLLRTSEGHSPGVPPAQILISIVLFTAVYTCLGALAFYLNRRTVLAGPHAGGEKGVTP